MQTRNPKLKDFLQKLSGKEIYADFTDIDNTKTNPMGYGMYDVRNSPVEVGPFMIDYVSATTNVGSVVTKITVRVPNLDIDAVAFVDSVLDDGKQVAPDFIAFRNLIKSLKTRPSAMSYNEAFDKFFYLTTGPAIRKANAEKCVNARVIYDVINQMILMGPQNTECVKIENGYRVSVRFPNNELEEITFQIIDHYDTFGGYPSIKIEIPSIGLCDTFLSKKHNEYKHEMVFNQAQRYLQSLESGKTIALGTEYFSRFDAPYRHLMAQVLNTRKVK